VPKAASSDTKGDPTIESQHSMGMESGSSVGNTPKNKLSDGSPGNSIAMESNSIIENQELQENQNDIEINALVSDDVKKESTTEATAALVGSSEVEREANKAFVVANSKDGQEAKAQKSIAMDMAQDNSSSEDGTSDFQSKGTTNQLIHINTIYFDYDKYDIRFDAKIELEKIAVVLKENPDTKIKVNAHTDIRGKKPYNLKLSKSRAYTTVQYLLNKGIEEERISSEGYGETQVAEKCTKGKPCTGLQHQLNRRSEFLIVDKFSDAVVAQSINKRASGNYAANGKTSNSGLYLNYDFSDNREVYTVQIGAFKGKVQTDKYSKLTDLFNYRYNDGLNRYYAGIFETSSEARSYMHKMRKQGFKDAFVVGLKGTDRF
ncbi:OmpA family protein, partial [Lutimonas sp.]|uniref:OmpA family protein n=1 Tax=Lutimonas sp. TaxID=1872403 RepID=UPI003C71CFEC